MVNSHLDSDFILSSQFFFLLLILFVTCSNSSSANFILYVSLTFLYCFIFCGNITSRSSSKFFILVIKFIDYSNEVVKHGIWILIAWSVIMPSILIRIICLPRFIFLFSNSIFFLHLLVYLHQDRYIFFHILRDYFINVHISSSVIEQVSYIHSE